MRAEVTSISSQHLDAPTLHEFCTKGRRIRNDANYKKAHDSYKANPSKFKSPPGVPG